VPDLEKVSFDGAHFFNTEINGNPVVYTESFNGDGVYFILDHEVQRSRRGRNLQSN
jgi:hypothetical protein